MTRSRMALSTASSRAELRSSATLTESARTSASSPGASDAARSRRGRSRGSTQTAGSTPPAAIDRSTRSAATAPPDRSMTVTSPPTASRSAATMVSSADQPERVPPATSTRSIPSGTGTPYQRFCVSNANRCRCHSLDEPGVLGLPGEEPALLVRPQPLDPLPLGLDPAAQHPLALARSRNRPARLPAGGWRWSGAATIARSRPPATQAPSPSAIAHRDGDDDLQRPVDQALLAPLGGEPVGRHLLPLLRHRAPGRRAGIRCGVAYSHPR